MAQCTVHTTAHCTVTELSHPLYSLLISLYFTVLYQALVQHRYFHWPCPGHTQPSAGSHCSPPLLEHDLSRACSLHVSQQHQSHCRLSNESAVGSDNEFHLQNGIQRDGEPAQAPRDHVLSNACDVRDDGVLDICLPGHVSSVADE